MTAAASDPKARHVSTIPRVNVTTTGPVGRLPGRRRRSNEGVSAGPALHADRPALAPRPACEPAQGTGYPEGR
jgi:hypothetical protein